MGAYRTTCRLLGDPAPIAPAVPLDKDNDYGTARYGLGAEGFCPCDAATDPPTATLVGHDGSGIGSRTILGYAPDTGVTVAVHANVQEISSNALARIAVGLATLANP